MPSLKALIPKLAQILGTTPATLYERQRALVRAKILTTERGRGPGSGVRATAQSLSLLLLGFLAAETLSEMETRVWQLLKLSPTKGAVRTNRESFHETLALIFSDQEKSSRVEQIKISRTHGRASIEFRPRPPRMIDKLALEDAPRIEFDVYPFSEPPGLHIDVTLEGWAVRSISDVVINAVGAIRSKNSKKRKRALNVGEKQPGH